MGRWALRTWLGPAGQPGGREGATRRGCSVLGRGDPAGPEGLAGGSAGGGAQEGELGARGQGEDAPCGGQRAGGEARFSRWPPLPHAPGSHEFF